MGIAPNCSLHPVKITDNPDLVLAEHAIAGITKARENGAKVISCSFGFGQRHSELELAIRQSGGCLFVFAAGNNKMDLEVTDYFPASFDLPNVLIVIATDTSGEWANYSNYCQTEIAHIAAPGGPLNACDIEADNDYEGMTGTSAAAPHVAGVCALAWSEAPHASVAQIKQCVLESATEVNALTPYCFR